MRLVLAVDALTPPLSGIGRYTWELASRLPAQTEIDALSFYRNGYWVAEPASLLVPLEPGATPDYKRAAGFLASNKWFRKLSARMRCHGALFHGPNYFLPACVETGVITVHDLSVFKFPEMHPEERIRQFEKNFLDSLTRACQLITDSETTRQEVIDFLGWPKERIAAVPLGVSEQFQPIDTAKLNPILARYGLTANGYCLCVSTLEPRKRIDRLLDAYALLAVEIRRRFPLILVGPAGWLNDALHRKIDAGTQAGWLKYLGFVPENDLPSLFAGARVFVYPSVYEGFGLPVAEAMASGVPVVTSNYSCLPEVTQGAALLIEPDDLDGFSAAIEQGLTDDAWRKQAKARGLAVAKKYQWQHCIEGTLSVYHKAIGQS